MTDTSFTIQWQPSESDGGSPIIEYIVEIKESQKKQFKKLASTKAMDTVLSINYLLKGTGYNFRISARNAIGISEPYLPEETITAGSRLSKIPFETFHIKLTNDSNCIWHIHRKFSLINFSKL